MVLVVYYLILFGRYIEITLLNLFLPPFFKNNFRPLQVHAQSAVDDKHEEVIRL